MKVHANSAPQGAFLLEPHPQIKNHTLIRLYENARETDGDAGWEYDEFTLIVPDSPGLAEKIEADTAAWLETAKALDVAYNAEQRVEEAVRPVIEAAHKAAPVLDDATASTVAILYPTMQYDGKLIAHGTRINWLGALKRAAVDLWDTKQNNPDNAPALWEDIQYKDGARVIPDTITVGLAFSKGELGWWHADGKTYKSLVNANVYTPAQYARNWEVL